MKHVYPWTKIVMTSDEWSVVECYPFAKCLRYLPKWQQRLMQLKGVEMGPKYLANLLFVLIV